jgi:hypothetical protein
MELAILRRRGPRLVPQLPFFTNYVKVAFFRGASLRPVPPRGESKHKDVRYVDIHEDELDEAQMAAWVRQAAALPGWLRSTGRNPMSA